MCVAKDRHRLGLDSTLPQSTTDGRRTTDDGRGTYAKTVREGLHRARRWRLLERRKAGGARPSRASRLKVRLGRRREKRAGGREVEREGARRYGAATREKIGIEETEKRLGVGKDAAK